MPRGGRERAENTATAAGCDDSATAVAPPKLIEGNEALA